MIKTLMCYGARKTGKTAFALSAPKPMVVFDFELGIDTVEPRYLPDMKQVTVYSMVEQTMLDKRKDLEANKKFWSEILTKYNDALENKDVKTIVFDTFSSVWAACRNCYLAELKEKDPSRSQLLAVEHGEPNRRMKMLLTQGRIHDKILILTHHVKDVYDDNGKATGEYTFDGFKYSGDLADVVIRFEKQNKKPFLTIEDCRLSMLAEGLHPESNFDAVETFINNIRKAGV